MASIDDADFDDRFRMESTEEETPESLYHRSWAKTLLGKVMDVMGAEYRGAGKGELFDVLRDKIAEPKGESSNDDAAQALGMSRGAVAVALHRMRGRYRELLRREVRETLDGDESEMDIDAELHQLLSVVK